MGHTYAKNIIYLKFKLNCILSDDPNPWITHILQLL